MGARLPPRPGAADKPKGNSLLKLLDELYAGGMPGAAPAQPSIDEFKMPSKKLLQEPMIDEEEEDESVDPPAKIIGSY